MVKTPTVVVLGRVVFATTMANLWSALLPPLLAKRIFIPQKASKRLWREKSFAPAYHDHSIFFDDDGKTYLIYGAGKLKILELKPDLSGKMEGTEEKTLIENASAAANAPIMLNAEGSQLFKHKDKYYLFNIVWPRGGMRTVLIHRADKITEAVGRKNCFARFGRSSRWLD